MPRAALELDTCVRPAGAKADDVGYVSVIDVRVAAFGLRLACRCAVSAVAELEATVGAVDCLDGRVRVEDSVEACVVAACMM